MEETIESINLITRKPGVRGGRPCIIGTGLRVTDIVVAMRYHGRTPTRLPRASRFRSPEYMRL